MAVDPTSSSTSSSPVVLKILIDLDEYLRLLDKKDHLDRQEKKLKDQLESSVKKNENSLENSQTGSGTEDHSANSNVSPNSLDHNTLQTIVDSVVEKIKSIYGLQSLPEEPLSKVQSGRGSSDLVPPLLGHVSVNETPPIVASDVVEKDDENSTAAEDYLLKTIPHRFHERTKQLINICNQSPQQLTWTSDGQIFINQQSVPLANIFKLLPAIFKPNSANRKLPGFDEFVTQIATMGFGHLMSPVLTRGLRRKSKIENQNELYSEIKDLDKNWYYLGPI